MEHPNVHRLTRGDQEIVLIGTAHVSKESAELVDMIIDQEKPDVVCVELCRARFDALKQQDKWQETDIVKVIRENRTSLLLSQLLMASFQRKIAEKFNINPGEEMLRAVARAEAAGKPIVLADREIRITLLRTWRMMRFWTKIKFMTEFIFSLFMHEDVTEEEIEKLKQHDVLDLALKTVGEKMPEVKTTLIDERDLYLAHEIAHAGKGKIVAVVGAGHVPGILQHIDQKIDIEEIVKVPPPSLWARFFGWGFSGAIISLFVLGFFYSGGQAGVDMMLSWSAITATCASVGAVIMLAHPFTILAAAVAAPVATLHPLVATGWVAGLVEASLRKPQVRDFLDLKNDIITLGGFFRNKITRLLILVAFVNLTTSVGTFVAIPVLMKYIFR